jgi:broad specificity phosphatase PhoE
VTARVILICHASTAAVREAAFPCDESLDEQGRTRAAALAGDLPRADRCWAGPELRARQTAEALRLNSEIEPLLRDCDYGSWRGRRLDELQRDEPEAVSVWLRDPEAAPHGGESLLALTRRVATWLAGQQTLHQQSIAVTHPAVIRAAIVNAIEATPQSFWRIDVAPLSCTRLSGNDNRWNLVSTGSSVNGGS